jgi:hypothetical protein
MKPNAIITLLSICFLIGSCAPKTKEKQQDIKVRASLIHPFYFQDEIGQQYNFPLWFNDSIIRARKIETLTHVIYVNPLDSDSQNDWVERLPKKTIVYRFDPNGQLTNVTQTAYSEGIIIANHNFYLKKSRWPYFYYVIPDDEHLGIESANHLYIPAAKKKNVTQYDDEIYDERLHYIENEKYYGALSVDSIANPSPTDWVILGSPFKPNKKYKVVNKVKETQVTTYEYWNGNYPKVVVNPEFPFTNKRYFVYDKGIFAGYRDSVFIDKDFVTMISTKIKYEKNGLPITVEHIKNHVGTTRPFKKIEEFKYTYYK